MDLVLQDQILYIFTILFVILIVFSVYLCTFIGIIHHCVQIVESWNRFQQNTVVTKSCELGFSLQSSSINEALCRKILEHHYSMNHIFVLPALAMHVTGS